MITSIIGTLETVTETSVILDRDGLAFEVLVPRGYAEELHDRHVGGETLRLQTIFMIEAGVAMSSMQPRLIGFRDVHEQKFFKIFTSVKGLGEKKALKALILPYRAIAAAIERGETATLLRLPGIGKRLADQIIAQLQGKLATFVADDEDLTATPKAMQGFAEDAMDILTGQLGFRDKDARERIDRALQEHPGIENAEQLMQVIFSQ